MLSRTDIDENIAAGVVVGTFSTEDPDLHDLHVYSFVDGFEDNKKFKIYNDELKSTQEFNFELQNSYYIYVRSTDESGFYVENGFTIYINDVAEPPSKIYFVQYAVEQYSPVGTVIGRFVAEYEEPLWEELEASNEFGFTFELCDSFANEGNSFFSIEGDELLIVEELNWEESDGYSLCVKAIDELGLSLETEILIDILKTFEVPTAIRLSIDWVRENEPIGTVVGELSSEDSDSNEFFTYDFVDNELYPFNQKF